MQIPQIFRKLPICNLKHLLETLHNASVFLGTSAESFLLSAHNQRGFARNAKTFLSVASCTAAAGLPTGMNPQCSKSLKTCALPYEGWLEGLGRGQKSKTHHCHVVLTRPSAAVSMEGKKVEMDVQQAIVAG